MTIPNVLTVFRMVLIPFFLMAVIYGHPRLALWIFVGAGLTDGLDGFIARFFNQKSTLGAFLDPMADKLILTSAYIALALPETGMAHTIPMWIVVLTIARDVVIVMLALILNLSHAIRSFPPSIPGKFTTFFQIAFAVAVLLQNGYYFPDWIVAFLLWSVAFFTVFSGLHYLWRMRIMIKDTP